MEKWAHLVKGIVLKMCFCLLISVVALESWLVSRFAEGKDQDRFYAGRGGWWRPGLSGWTETRGRQFCLQTKWCPRTVEQCWTNMNNLIHIIYNLLRAAAPAADPGKNPKSNPTWNPTETQKKPEIKLLRDVKLFCSILCCLYPKWNSPPARWGLLDFMSVACSSPPLLSSSSCSTATLNAQCSLSDLNHDHPRPVFPAGPQPRPSPPSVPCRTSTTTIHAQCSLPDLNREYPRQVFPAGPHVGRYGTKNVQKKVRKNVRQVCYILLANSRVCGRVTGAMPLLTLQVAKFEAISLNRWQSHWGGQRHFHFCTFGAVCKDAWDRQHLTASYYKLLEVISCWIDAWDSQHHTGFLLCITATVARWICDIGTFVGAFEPSSTRSRARGRMDIIIEEFSRRRLCDQ